jgi:hypothetical protein
MENGNENHEFADRTLARALRREPTKSLAAWLECSPSTIIIWRKKLKMEFGTSGGRLILSAQMDLKRRNDPTTFIQPGIERIMKEPIWRDVERGKISAGEAMWMPEEDEILKKLGGCKAAADQLGRSLNAVRQRAAKLGIKRAEIAGIPTRCPYCGFRWIATKAATRCANPHCRRRFRYIEALQARKKSFFNGDGNFAPILKKALHDCPLPRPQ